MKKNIIKIASALIFAALVAGAAVAAPAKKNASDGTVKIVTEHRSKPDRPSLGSIPVVSCRETTPRPSFIRLP